VKHTAVSICFHVSFDIFKIVTPQYFSIHSTLHCTLQDFKSKQHYNCSSLITSFSCIITTIDLLGFDVYLPNSNQKRIQIICHVNMFTPWQKERTLEGLRVGQFAYKANTNRPILLFFYHPISLRRMWFIMHGKTMETKQCIIVFCLIVFVCFLNYIFE